MRPAVRPVTAVLVASALLVTLSGSAFAKTALGKEWLQATLDAPIAMDTPAGTELLVGVTVLAPGDDGTMQPVEGSPIRLILTGRYGATTYAAGAWDGTPGHYAMRITIPAGGARRAVVAMHGTSDLPLTLTTDPFTFGGITARTAQVAPPLAPPMTPLPRASAAAEAPVQPVAPAQAPAEAPAPVAAPGGLPPALVPGGLALVLVLAIGLVAVARRSAGHGAGVRAGVDAHGRTPGA